MTRQHTAENAQALPSSLPGKPRKRSAQGGVVAVEFALVVVVFFLFVFSIMEVSRALYLWNTLQEVTRRAARDAAVTDFSDPSAMEMVKRTAIFRTSPGTLTLGAPVNEQYVRIDYLSLQNDTNRNLKQVAIPTGALPACPARNRLICTARPGDPGCIRMVRVRICAPGGGSECAPVPYEPMFPLVSLGIHLPASETVVRAQSLGYVAGAPLCN